MKVTQKKALLLPALLAAASSGAIAADKVSTPQTADLDRSAIKKTAIELTAAEMDAVVAGSSYFSGKGVFTAVMNNGGFNPDTGYGPNRGVTQNWMRGNCVGAGRWTAASRQYSDGYYCGSPE